MDRAEEEDALTNHRDLVALTFDDGPHLEYTPMILETLSAAGAKATFFVRGSALTEATAEIIRDAFEAGHEIANHTYSHHSLAGLGAEVIEGEMRLTHDQLREITGVEPTLVRPPYGHGPNEVNAVAERLGYRATIMWSVSAEDWTNPQPTAETIAERVLASIGPGGVVLLHDGCAPEREGDSRLQTAQAVELLIPRLRAAGLELATVSELMSNRA